MIPEPDLELRLGARPVGDGGCSFRVWAPNAGRVELLLLGDDGRTLVLEREDDGHHCVVVEDVPAGTRYLYRLDDGPGRPDPASRFQPEGVHGPSEVVDPSFEWTDDDWNGRALEELVFYELHVGTFTDEGTFGAAIRRLDDLVELGVSAVELMPVAQFPGARNWGYDGACPWAVQDSYGGPEGLRRFVDACHARSLCVVLDVVYNHLGPEGNYLDLFGPYFTDAYHTPWGKALNFDHGGSDHVRRFFVESALHWIVEHHVDAFRLDAIHAIVDASARPFVEELTRTAHAAGEARGRRVQVIAESDANDSRTIRPWAAGGLGCDAQWSDDVHHSLHALLTGERRGYYSDFGRVEHLARALGEGWTYSGHRSEYRGRRHGNDASDLPPERFVACAQNHDQVGNRAGSERLASLVDGEALKLAAGVILLSPYLPLIFMGEEHGETAPFWYFVSHGDPELLRAVREGRKREFSAFDWKAEPADPSAAETFDAARVDWSLAERGEGRRLRDLYRTLLALRRERTSLGTGPRDATRVAAREGERLLTMHRSGPRDESWALFHLGDASRTVEVEPPGGGREWSLLLESTDERFGGPGGRCPATLAGGRRSRADLSPWSFALWGREA